MKKYCPVYGSEVCEDDFYIDSHGNHLYICGYCIDEYEKSINETEYEDD